MLNDQRLVALALGDAGTALLPSPLLEEVRRHVTANTKAPPWVATARQIGQAWMLEQQKKTGFIPSVKDIGQYVEGELSNRHITSARGEYLDRETIVRRALTGITNRKRGQNLLR